MISVEKLRFYFLKHNSKTDALKNFKSYVETKSGHIVKTLRSYQRNDTYQRDEYMVGDDFLKNQELNTS